MVRIARSLRFLVRALTAESSPDQVALACSIGMMLGLVPKGNLTAAMLLGLLFVLRVNILSGLLSAAVFSCVGILTTPILDWFGENVLRVSAVQGFYAWMYDAPVMPWTDFNNTVTAGGFILGLLLVFPAYCLLTAYFRQRIPEWSATVRRREIGRALLGDDNGLTSWRVG